MNNKNLSVTDAVLSSVMKNCRAQIRKEIKEDVSRLKKENAQLKRDLRTMKKLYKEAVKKVEDVEKSKKKLLNAARKLDRKSKRLKAQGARKLSSITCKEWQNWRTRKNEEAGMREISKLLKGV